MNARKYELICVSVLAAAAMLIPRVTAQQLAKGGRETAETMLQAIAADIKEHYYDPKFHGLDWDGIVGEAEARIEKSATYDMALLDIAAAVDSLNDSHTVWIPPRSFINHPGYNFVTDWRSLMPIANFRHSYGWEHEMVGEHCLVTHVRPGHDAEKKGLHVGDEILSINGYQPQRQTIQKAEYVFDILRPQTELKLEVLDPLESRLTSPLQQTSSRLPGCPSMSAVQ